MVGFQKTNIMNRKINQKKSKIKIKKKPPEHEFRRLINDMSMTLFYCHYILSETCHRANCIVAYFKVDNNPVTSLCISRNGNFC